MYIDSHGHMTKDLKIFFSRTRRPLILKLGVKHQGDELFKVSVNHDLGMTLTDYIQRSTLVAHAFEWKKLVKCH